MRLFGKNALREVIQTGNNRLITQVFLLPQIAEKDRELIHILNSFGIPFAKQPLETMNRLVDKGDSHQGVIFQIRSFPYASLDQILSGPGIPDLSCVILLDQIQDPQNLGAIIRTSAAMDATCVVILKDNAAQITPSVIKASAGMAFAIPICLETNMCRSIQKLQELGFWIYGSHAKGTAYPLIEFPRKIGLVMGNEGVGLRKRVFEHCDQLVSIPMSSKADSLNVSVSMAILGYAWKVSYWDQSIRAES